MEQAGARPAGCPITELPDECILKVLKFNTVKDAEALMRTCTSLRDSILRLVAMCVITDPSNVLRTKQAKRAVQTTIRTSGNVNLRIVGYQSMNEDSSWPWEYKYLERCHAGMQKLWRNDWTTVTRVELQGLRLPGVIHTDMVLACPNLTALVVKSCMITTHSAPSRQKTDCRYMFTSVLDDSDDVHVEDLLPYIMDEFFEGDMGSDLLECSGYGYCRDDSDSEAGDGIGSDKTLPDEASIGDPTYVAKHGDGDDLAGGDMQGLGKTDEQNDRPGTTASSCEVSGDDDSSCGSDEDGICIPLPKLEYLRLQNLTMEWSYIHEKVKELSDYFQDYVPSAWEESRDAERLYSILKHRMDMAFRQQVLEQQQQQHQQTDMVTSFKNFTLFSQAEESDSSSEWVTDDDADADDGTASGPSSGSETSAPRNEFQAAAKHIESAWDLIEDLIDQQRQMHHRHESESLHETLCSIVSTRRLHQQVEEMFKSKSILLHLHEPGLQNVEDFVQAIRENPALDAEQAVLTHVIVNQGDECLSSLVTKQPGNRIAVGSLVDYLLSPNGGKAILNALGLQSLHASDAPVPAQQNKQKHKQQGLQPYTDDMLWHLSREYLKYSMLISNDDDGRGPHAAVLPAATGLKFISLCQRTARTAQDMIDLTHDFYLQLLQQVPEGEGLRHASLKAARHNMMLIQAADALSQGKDFCYEDEDQVFMVSMEWEEDPLYTYRSLVQESRGKCIVHAQMSLEVLSQMDSGIAELSELFANVHYITLLTGSRSVQTLTLIEQSKYHAGQNTGCLSRLRDAGERPFRSKSIQQGFELRKLCEMRLKQCAAAVQRQRAEIQRDLSALPAVRRLDLVHLDREDFVLTQSQQPAAVEDASVAMHVDQALAIQPASGAAVPTAAVPGEPPADVSRTVMNLHPLYASLIHIRILQSITDDSMMRQLLQFPCLEHVAVYPRLRTDFSENTCRWQTLCVDPGTYPHGLAQLALLPLHSLKQPVKLVKNSNKLDGPSLGDCPEMLQQLRKSSEHVKLCQGYQWSTWGLTSWGKPSADLPIPSQAAFDMYTSYGRDSDKSLWVQTSFWEWDEENPEHVQLADEVMCEIMKWLDRRRHRIVVVDTSEMTAIGWPCILKHIITHRVRILDLSRVTEWSSSEQLQSLLQQLPANVKCVQVGRSVRDFEWSIEDMAIMCRNATRPITLQFNIIPEGNTAEQIEQMLSNQLVTIKCPKRR